MDGLEAVKRLREAGYSKAVIALRAQAMKGDKERCLAQGFDDYLCKPLVRNDLLNCLVRHLKQLSDSL